MSLCYSWSACRVKPKSNTAAIAWTDELPLRSASNSQTVRRSDGVFLVAEHYITLPGSCNGFPEMCCVPLSHVYIRVKDVVAFSLFSCSFFQSVPAACCLNYAEPGIATGQKNMPGQQQLLTACHAQALVQLSALCDRSKASEAPASTSARKLKSDVIWLN